MKDYTHECAVIFADIMDGDKKYTEEKKIVMTYGLELIFNSLLKKFFEK